MTESNENAASVEKAANLYFSSMNPLSKRIHSDIAEMSKAFSHLWNDFTTKERNEAINDTLIKPEYVLKYLEDILISSPQRSVDKSMAHGGKSSNHGGSFDDDDSSTDASMNSSSSNLISKYLYDEKHLSTYARLLTGQRQVHEDILGIYLDEHSAPFSFKTRSQININILGVDEVAPQNCILNSAQMVLPIKNMKTKSECAARSTDSTSISNKSSKSKSKKKSSSKYSIASSINSQNSRKNFMSKLFSSLAHGNGDGNAILSQDDDEKQTLFIDEPSMDMITATDVMNIETDHRSTQREHDNGKQNNCNEFKALLSSDDPSKDYDFLNNW